jgi:hypothetical protein
VIGAFPIQTHQSSTKGHRPSRGERSPVRTATAPQAKPVPLLCCVVCRAGRGRALVQCVLSAVLGLVLLGGAAAAPSGPERMSGVAVLRGLSEDAVPFGDGDSRPVGERSRSSPLWSKAKACSGKSRDRRISGCEASHPPNGHASPHSSDFWPSAPGGPPTLLPRGTGSADHPIRAAGASMCSGAEAAMTGSAGLSRFRGGGLREQLRRGGGGE